MYLRPAIVFIAIAEQGLRKLGRLDTQTISGASLILLIVNGSHHKTSILMDKEELVTVFSRELQVSPVQAAQLLEMGRLITHAKGTVIHRPGEVFEDLGFLIQGATRTYFKNKDNEDVSYLLNVEGDTYGDYESYVTGKPSTFSIEAVTNVVAIHFSKSQIEQLSNEDNIWLRVARRISDLAFLDAKQRLDDILLLTPEERYLKLVEARPRILQVMPLMYVSSYIGITPQSLSRIRKRIIT